MKRYLILVFLIISYLGFSQQVLKKITDTGDYTIVDLYSFRNGTDNTTITGADNFFGLNQQYNFKFYFWDSNITVVLPWIQPTLYFLDPISYPSLSSPSSEVICYTNISFYNYSNTIIYGPNGFEYGSPLNSMAIYPYPSPLINSKIFQQHADTNDDGNIDCFKYEARIPKKMTDGNLIPTTTLWCKVEAIKPDYYCTGTSGQLCTFQSPAVYLKFNGTTWVEQTVDWNSNPITILQEFCSPLSIDENQNLNKKISIYPNPTKNYINIKYSESTNENFQYSILDLTGRIVKNGTTKFSEQINIESLTSGNYIIQIEIENGKKVTEKLIKN
jgi:hypothetical protein